MSDQIDLSRFARAAKRAARPAVEGRLSEIVGLVMEAQGCRAAIGDVYELHPDGMPSVEAEVVGIRGGNTLLMPLGDTYGLQAGCPVRRVGRAARARVGDALLGRVVDGMGRPLDGGPTPDCTLEMSLHGQQRNPLLRRPVQEEVRVGVRAIDGLLSLGKGQRTGIFAGAGVGKSSLLAMMIRRTQADVCVMGLIGERGREVEEFVNRILGESGREKAVVVAATSASPPLVRARGALYATTIAEYFRSQGKSVLLLMDSLTRYAQALREVGLAVGEPPTTKGYTPSVFASLPRLLERAGTCQGPGSITGIYTVLVEGDDLNDPVADGVRAILDGHIVLSRDLAERGHFPAIDVSKSISRVFGDVAPESRQQCAARARELFANYREAEDLVAIGAYQQGAMPRLDEALARMPRLEGFLKQGFNEDFPPENLDPDLNAVWSDA